MNRIGQVLKIDYMEGEPAYAGRIGAIERIDDMGQLHGTWGGCAIIPGEDIFHEATAAEIGEWERAKAERPSYAPRKNVTGEILEAAVQALQDFEKKVKSLKHGEKN